MRIYIHEIIVGGVVARRNDGWARASRGAKLTTMGDVRENLSWSGLLGGGTIAVTATTALMMAGPNLILVFTLGFSGSADGDVGILRFLAAAFGQAALSIPLGLFGACLALWLTFRRILPGLAAQRPGLAGSAAGLAHTAFGLLLIGLLVLIDEPPYGASLVGTVFAIPLILNGHLLLVFAVLIFRDSSLPPDLGIALGVLSVAICASAAGFLAGRFYAWRVRRYRLKSDSNGSSENSASTGTSK